MPEWRNFSGDTSWVAGGAVLSPPPSKGGIPRYRYMLERWWEPGGDFILWVLLNPADADASKPDNTVTKCIERTRSIRPSFGGLRIVNLFAWRDPRPQTLRHLSFEEAVGNPYTDAFVQMVTASAGLTIVGWGDARGVEGSWLDEREAAMWEVLVDPHCLGSTDKGRPCHPKPQNSSQLPVETEPSRWKGPRRRNFPTRRIPD
jgi:hypothetical protein